MFNSFFIKLIRLYQIIISPLIGQNCRYFPSCSNYGIEALKEYNFFKAVYLILIRILKCNPWGGSGIDQLPIKNVKNKN
tara:strand:- start:243 stop:479 length:237 start_codon:yes stop_codon:yes gene_type:complete